jgi:uncharacterized protein involved in exopolysaccharide biosynthesis
MLLRRLPDGPALQRVRDGAREGSGLLERNVNAPDEAGAPAAGPKAPGPITLDGRHWSWWAVLLLAPIVVCAAVAYLVSSALPEVFAARAELVFQAPPGREITEQYRATQTVLLTGRTVLAPVSTNVGIPVRDLTKAVRVAFPKGGAVMEVQVADRDGDRALSLLNAILDRYLLVREQIDADEEVEYRLLVAPYLDPEPVGPKPLQAAAIGGVLGIAISLAAFALLQRRWTTGRA